MTIDEQGRSDRAGSPRRPVRRAARRRGRVGAAALAFACLVVLSACGGEGGFGSGKARNVTLGEFVEAPDAPTDGDETPTESTRTETTVTEVTVDEDGEVIARETVIDAETFQDDRSDGALTAGADPAPPAEEEWDGPGTGSLPSRRDQAAPRRVARDDPGLDEDDDDEDDGPRAPRDWIVDSLVGQVNGRPIFAEEFLEPVEDRLMRIVESEPRATSRDAIIAIVSQRFEDWVNNELIIAEAESQLSPEQQQGLLAWLREIQEDEIAARGGTRVAAESDLQEDQGISIEEYMEQRRNFALAGNLLRQRIGPRVIVSWRDVQREYKRRIDEFNPGTTIRIGRIRLRQRETDLVELVTSRFAAGADFPTVTRELEIPDDAFWLERELGEEGLDSTDLSDTIKDLLRDLDPGEASAPQELGRSIYWYSIISVDSPPQRDIYDRDVQTSLRIELERRRESQEQARYIRSLRKRWVAEGIDDMRLRLVEISLRRYWR